MFARPGLPVNYGKRRAAATTDWASTFAFNEFFCRDLRACGWLATDFATSRAHPMKRLAVGLSIRFFNVMISTAWEISVILVLRYLQKSGLSACGIGSRF
jgi:hypothetical protein